MADIITETRVLEEGELVLGCESDEEPEVEEVEEVPPRETRQSSEFYHNIHMASTTLRFAVGDKVTCTVEKGRRVDGVVIRRFYREDDLRNELRREGR